MSLPPAPKDISNNPAAGAVTDPVDKQAKDSDVDRKLRFYGVIEAFRQGRLPDNSQIDHTLTYVRDNSFVDINKLSPDGKTLVQDVRDIVETARQIVAEKNADELFQNFIWHTGDTEFNRAKQDPNEVIPVSNEKARADGQEAVKHLRTLLSLVLTNSEARKLLSDVALIGRDLLARGAAKSAELIGPAPEQLEGIDKSAPRDEFITQGGRKAGPNETPVPEVSIPGTDTTVAQHPHNELGTGAEVRTNGETRSGGDVLDQGRGVLDDAKQRAPQAQDEAKDVARAHADDVRGDVDAAPTGTEKKEVAKGGFKDKVMGFKDGLLDRIPQQHKDRAQDHVERGRTFLSEEYFPEERRDQFIYRGKKVIVECQRHDDYQQSIRWLLSFLEQYAGHARGAGGKATESHGALTEDPSLQQAMRELRTLLERFANGRTFDGITNAVDNLYTDARQDEELRNWFKQVDAYARKTLLEPGYVLEPDCNNEANRLRESGKQFYDGKYKGHFDALFDEIGSWFGAMGDDPLNARFGQDWARLTRDLLFDADGALTFKPALWEDIKTVIVPALIDHVGYIPIPRIEYTDDSLDLVLENLTLSGRNLFPNVVSLEAHNFVRFSPYKGVTDEQHHDFTFTFGHMQADMRDVAFYFRKKTGIKIKDSGIADVVLGGQGLTVTVHLASAGKDKSSVFKVKNVNVKVDSLKFAIRDSKHDTLYNTVRPLATGLVKKQIQRAFQDAITTGLEYVDGQLVGVRDRMAEAKDSETTSRTEVLKELFQHKKGDVQSVKSNTNAQFKVVAKRDSAILTDQGHPSGWVNRQAEKEQAAKDGHEWRSQAFAIV